MPTRHYILEIEDLTLAKELFTIFDFIGKKRAINLRKFADQTNYNFITNDMKSRERYSQTIIGGRCKKKSQPSARLQIKQFDYVLINVRLHSTRKQQNLHSIN